MATGKALPAIAAVDASTVDATYGSQEAAVIADLRTKFDALIAALKARGDMDR